MEKGYLDPELNSEYIFNILGINDRGTDYNHTLRNDGYHAWIGRNNNGEVISVQTLPWNMRAAGCGEGIDGSADNGWIQINICEELLNNKEYFYSIYSELIHLTAYLCELFDIDPIQTIKLNNSFSNKTYPTLMDHQEAYKLGIATPRTDVFHWFKKYDINMRKSRIDVINLINNTVSPYRKLNSTSSKVLDIEDIEIEIPVSEENTAYKAKVSVNRLNVRKGPSTENDILYVANKDDILLIREYNESPGWGQILDNEKNGWINLQYIEKVEEPLE